MRNIVTLLLSLFSLSALAQPAGFKKAADVKNFQTSLGKANQQVQNIASDFRQTKNMSLLAEKIKSSGKFYFKKEDKVRIEYTEPYTYLMVMNGTRMLVKDEKKTSKINAGNSKMMQSVNRVMVDCMRGTVLDNKDFKASTYESTKQYLVSLVPATAEMKKMFEQIDVYFDKGSFDVDKLVMTEAGGDFTHIDFFNTRHNTALNEALFNVR